MASARETSEMMAAEARTAFLVIYFWANDEGFARDACFGWHFALRPALSWASR